jgi:hypothetical protein
VCIHCYGPSKQVYLWKWGINYVCDHCLKIAKRAIGYEGLFNTVAQAEARREMVLRFAAEKKRRK